MTWTARATSLALVTLAVAFTSHDLTAQERLQDPARRPPAAVAQLSPTSHPPLPGTPAQFWLIPDSSTTSRPATRGQEDPGLRFAKGAALIAQGDHAAGLPLVTHPDVVKTPLAGYAQYYAGVALLELSRLAEADATLTALV